MTMDQPLLPDFSLVGKTALVTGASKGIGRGLAIALAQAGADVAVTARSESELADVVEEIRENGRKGLAVAANLRSKSDIESLFRQVETAFGRVDILVNNAGLGANAPAQDVSEADWDEMMDVNLKGLFFCCQAAGRLMLARGYGRIINMSSQAGLVGIRDHAVYAASKGGVNMLTRVLALEWSARGVNVNAVAPTFIYTPGTALRLDQPAYLEGVLARLPIGRVGTIADVAGAVIYLASAAGDLVTGTILSVDGGWTAQ